VAHHYSLNMPRSINLLTLDYVPYTITMESANTLKLHSSGLILNRTSDRSVFNSSGLNYLGLFSPWYAIQDFNGIFSPVDFNVDLKVAANIEESILGGATFYSTIHQKNKNNQISDITFTFDKNLKNKSYVFLYWDKDKYTEISFQELKESGYEAKGI